MLIQSPAPDSRLLRGEWFDFSLYSLFYSWELWLYCRNIADSESASWRTAYKILWLLARLLRRCSLFPDPCNEGQETPITAKRPEVGFVFHFEPESDRQIVVHGFAQKQKRFVSPAGDRLHASQDVGGKGGMRMIRPEDTPANGERLSLQVFRLGVVTLLL